VSLWDFALSLYARPGVEPACLALQDAHAQCVPLLLWRLWALDRRVDAAMLQSAVALARDWEARVVGPLRSVRRSLAEPTAPIADAARLALRADVKDGELAAERALLAGLEALTSQDDAVGKAATDALIELADAWARPAPIALLTLLAVAAGSVTDAPPAERDTAMNDDAAGEDETSDRLALADLRLAHQDFDAAIASLEAVPKVDQLQIARLKKRKLGLRDQITRLEERLTPDIIA
jgi:uncharacterized protein (TIGR02444 family)